MKLYSKIKEFIKTLKSKSSNLGLLSYIFLYCFDLTRVLVYNIKFFSNIKNIRQLKLIKNKHMNDNIFVFAGGPSLKKLDFEKVKNYQQKNNYKVLCINFYITGHLAETVIPNYYCLADPAFFKDNISIKESLKAEVQKVIDKLAYYKISTFVPMEFVSAAKNKGLNAYGFNNSEYKWGSQNISLFYPRSYLSMTAYNSLAVSMFLGFKNIYICGIDNSYFKNLQVDSKNQISFLDDHAVKQVTSGSIMYKYSVGRFFSNMSDLFNDLYIFSNDRITNLDKDSLVDAFNKEHNLDIIGIKI